MFRNEAVGRKELSRVLHAKKGSSVFSSQEKKRKEKKRNEGIYPSKNDYKGQDQAHQGLNSFPAWSWKLEIKVSRGVPT